jgi:hypothetical protein
MGQEPIDFFEKKLVKTWLLLLFFKKYIWVCQVVRPDSWPEPCLRLTSESSFKTIIIITFIYILTQVNPCWPSKLITWVLPRSTPKSDFKTMIINTFILTLNQINLTHDLGLDWWLKFCPRSTPESDFKTMIINTFILTLNQVNLTHDLGLDWWLKFCLRSTPNWILKLW